VIEYITDGKGRRIAKMIDGVIVKQWLWSNRLRIASELDGLGNLVSQFIYGDKVNLPELLIANGKTCRIVTEQLGSSELVVNIADSTDTLMQATYDAWGNRLISASSWKPHCLRTTVVLSER
jgi:hypothetical protein